MLSSKHKQGFTLIEVILAMTLFSITMVAIFGTRAASQKMVVKSELLAKAVELTRLKMTESELKFQALVNKSGVKAARGEEEGVFELPPQYKSNNFKWKAQFAENPLRVDEEVIIELMTSFGVEEEIAKTQYEEQKLLFTNLNKALDENVGELSVTVTWNFYSKPQKFVLVTHLIPQKPKITFVTEASE